MMNHRYHLAFKVTCRMHRRVSSVAGLETVSLWPLFALGPPPFRVPTSLRFLKINFFVTAGSEICVVSAQQESNRVPGSQTYHHRNRTIQTHVSRSPSMRRRNETASVSFSTAGQNFNVDRQCTFRSSPSGILSCVLRLHWSLGQNTDVCGGRHCFGPSVSYYFRSRT